ncbi:hypothetical protein Cgig2_031693 [Carnegiea gigantea]|uniref:Tetratricopeptide repeat protein 5 OB fold domain-containing protein n=1 Tax=Carnegiea gigantea TaxID=171969 RepID=A0A9Q1KRK1_9CARY|nr:hypothetical protein Cgig2_031693 [Carnegiea gigantea]
MSTQIQSQNLSDTNEDPLVEASKATDDLYKIRDTYYPPNPDDKISKLHQESLRCLNILDSLPPDTVDVKAYVLAEFRKSAMQRATFEHLKGKILDVIPEYKKEAEDHLSKAVKLNPSLTDAWLSLGNCFWKKGDLVSAKNCFTRALSKGPEKNILCQLSMLERKMAQGMCSSLFSSVASHILFGSENQAEIVEESIKHAKEAIALDVTDGNSWYNLGNACLTSFFVTGAWDHSRLSQSLKAYQNAEKDEKMKLNPDLFFNCATVNKYLENYEKALSGFDAAAKIDPGLNASEEVQKIVHLLDKLDSLLKGPTKAKRLASLVSSLAAVDVNPSYRKATVDHLFEGLNKSIAVIGKVLFFVKHENIAPLYYVVCDSNQVCFLLSVYGINDNVVRWEAGETAYFVLFIRIKEGDQITLLEPWYKNVDFPWNGKCYQFKSIRVDFKEQILVNGRAISANQALQSHALAPTPTTTMGSSP